MHFGASLKCGRFSTIMSYWQGRFIAYSGILFETTINKQTKKPIHDQVERAVW